MPGELLDHRVLLAEAGNGVVEAMLAFETQITAEQDDGACLLMRLLRAGLTD